MLNVTGLSVAQRIQKLSFSLEGGQLVGLIGANGAGKSTLLKTLAGLIDSTAGSASWHQFDMLTWSPHQQRQNLAYLAQSSLFLEPVTVLNLLELSQMNLSAKSALLAEWRAQSIADFELNRLINRPITELSGGEQRRVAIACMAAQQRSFVILDEPVAGLDLYYQLLTMDWLRTYTQQGGLAFVALHDLSLAAQYCDKLLLLHRGKQVALGEPNCVLTDTNLAHAYRVGVDWICNSSGVAMLPHRLPN